MRRRALDDPAAAAPAWVRTFDPAAWSQPAEDEDPQLLAEAAKLWGLKRARQIRAQARWSDAVGAWCTEHGVSRKDARARSPRSLPLGSFYS